MATPSTSHFAELIDGVLEFSRQHESPATYARLCRRVAGNAAQRADQSALAKRWARAATANLIAAHRAAHPKKSA